MKINIFDILGKTQEQLLRYVVCRLEERGYGSNLFLSDKYVFATGKIPVLLVAHLDTVHQKLPEIFYDKKQGIIWSPQGIGGDDRCGVYAILKIIEKYKPYVLFTTDEEVGGLGAEAFTKEIDRPLIYPINFAIEIDRRGFNEAVFYDCGNDKFINFILQYGFTEEWGSFSDISVLSPAFDIASVNLSAGYYNEHTNHEYIVLGDLNHTIERVKKILRSQETNTYFDYQEKYFYNYKNIKANNIEQEEYYFFEEQEDDYYRLTAEKWKEKYGVEKPKTIDDFYTKYSPEGL